MVFEEVMNHTVITSIPPMTYLLAIKFSFMTDVFHNLVPFISHE